MQILITGATGLVGNNMVRLLLEQHDHRVEVLVRNPDARALADLDVVIHQGDVRDAESVDRAIRGADLIIHAAALVQIGRTKIDDFRATNVMGTKNVAEAASRHGIRLVHVSSTDTIGFQSLQEPANEETPFDSSICTPYIVTKHEAEQVILQQVNEGLNAVITNPSFMLGPWDWKPSSGEMLLAVGRGASWVAPEGYFSVTDVRDVCGGILAAAERGAIGSRYILAGQTMSYLEAWRLFAEVTGGRRPLWSIGKQSGMIIGWIGDAIGMMTGKEPGFNSGAMKIVNKPRNYSSDRAKLSLDYQNRSLRETVRDAWEWFCQHGYVN